MIRQTKTPVFTFISAVVASFLLAGCVIHVGASDYEDNHEKKHYYKSSNSYTSANKSVNVQDGVTTDEISSTNGSVRVGNRVTAKEITSNNGSLDIGDDVTADEISSVNGTIRIGEGASIARNIEGVNGKVVIDDNASVGQNIETINGKIKVGNNSKVKGKIETVNGSIELSGTTVDKNIETVNGNIYVQNGSHVKGDIILSGKRKRNSSWYNKPSKVVIDSSSSVDGKIIVYREVEFEFDDESLMSKVERRYEAL
ncbi:hypothetical protein [Agaribacter marinus]|uniref:Polymer-forming cytoskeletal protein n=1 Tax=Agaribacter marinus TaxID=1431249 RepID=A0AA37WGW0_9ALTE|nr:hypothetical protein [Agaribacter marinus]GLR69347.1 hypothetical protein GCM10007852_02550 [Agaribacter marinus]